MRILLVTTSFSLIQGDDNLINDLAHALARQGHHIQVVLLDWSAAERTPPRRTSISDAIDVLILSPRSLRGVGIFVDRATKWMLSSWYARHAMRRVLGRKQFDLLVGFSPATATLAQLTYSIKKCQRSYMVMWDFFPFHHRSIGLITNIAVFKVAYWVEAWLVRKFDVIGCMTPANEAYLRKHYAISPTQEVEIMPIWGQTSQQEPEQRSPFRAAFDLPVDKKIVVFGGQLSEGRGLEDLLAAAEFLRVSHPDLTFLVIGNGRLAEFVRLRADRSNSNLIYRERIPRSEYLKLLTVCDAGLVCTVRNVDVPTFPSKTIDYLRAGIPVIASVEATTDFGCFVESNGLGCSCQAGEPGALAATIVRVVSDVELASAVRERARECLERVFNVDRAAERIVGNH